MPSAQANAILRDLERHKTLFNLDNGLGVKLMDAAAEGFFDCMNRQEDPDGVPWPPLSEAYAKWKSKNYPGELMAELEHRMKTLEQLDGEREIGEYEAKQTYGVDDGARTEAEWMIDPDDKSGRPSRRFYEFDAATIERLDKVVDDHGDKGIG
jgi:hypothetical protein